MGKPHVPFLPVVSLCTGAGRLDEAVSRAFHPTPLRVVCYMEREAFAAAYLVGEMAAGRLDEAPVWSDLACAPIRLLERLRPVVQDVGVVTAGFPCQPWSAAGRRAGADDHRWIWGAIARVLRHLRPGAVALECTPNVLAGGAEEISGTLAELGFDAEWDCTRASDIGAPHQRLRWWCFAATGPGRELLRQGLISDPDSLPLRLRSERGSGATQAPDERDSEPVGVGTSFPPGPDSKGWEQVLESNPELAPALSGENDRRVESALRGLAHGLVSEKHADLLRLIGNGVVPEQGATTFRLLIKRLLENDQ